jgi:hypothetical protein
MSVRVALIIVLAFFVVIGIWTVQRRRRRLPPSLEARPDLSLSEIQNEFYRDLTVSQERFAQLWNDVAKAFEIPAGRIRPGDRLGVDLPLRPIFGTTDEDMILAGSMKRRCKDLGIETPSTLPKTVDEYVRLLAQPPSRGRRSAST